MALHSLSTLVLEQLAGASLRALCLAALAAILLAILRPRTASLRYVAWTAVLLSMLALPFATNILPGWLIPAPAALSRAVPHPDPTRVAGGSIVIDVRDGRVQPPRAASAVSAPLWPSLLIGLYLMVLGALLTRLIVGLVLSARLAARSTLIRDARVQRILEEIAGAQGYGYPPPRVCESGEIAAPVLAGAGGVAILLPRQWRAWDDWKLRAVLAHEFTHERRGDWTILLIAAINRCLFWFHPLAWWLEKQLSKLSELASDDAGAWITGDPVRYAQLLLDVSAEARGTRGPRIVLPMAGAANLSRRIHRLLDLRNPSSGIVSPRRRLAVLAIAVPCFIAIAAAQFSAPAYVALQGDPPDSWQWEKEGFETTADDAARFELQVKKEPGDLTARARLIAHYLYNALPDPLANHVLYVIEHHPESRLAGSFPVSVLYPRPADPNLERKAQLWRGQAASHGSHPRVLENAARFFAQTDQTLAEQLLQQAIALEPGNPELKTRLATLYAEALRSDTYSSVGLHPVGPWHAVQPSFARAVEDRLSESIDADLIGAVGASLAAGVAGSIEMRVNQQHLVNQARLTIAAHAERLLSRAQALVPGDARWPEAILLLRNGFPIPAPKAASDASPPIRVRTSEQARRLLESALPAYPALARQARLQGTVRLDLTINPEGRVTAAQVLAGHPLLVPAALDAVKSRVYSPAIVNGAPVSVETTVDVNFSLTSLPPLR